MSQREPVQSRPASREQDDVATPVSSSAPADTDVDAILDEIDAVLEENAEDFVRSFVQKGGQ